METNWTGVKSISDKDIGFTYIVENLINGKRYVGSKVLYKPDGKSSNWKNYKTSSKYLKEDMSKLGEDNFRFRIISFHENIEEMYELEQFTQETLDVLRSRLSNGELEFYNKRINGKACISKVEDPIVYEEVCRKISKKSKERLSNPENHPMKGRVHPNKGKKLPQTGHNKNLGKVLYTNGKTYKFIDKGGVIPKGWYKGVGMNHGINKRVSQIKEKSVINRENYYKNPKKCKICKGIISFEKRLSNTYCSRKCHSRSTKGRVGHKGANNPSHKGYYYKTPLGIFETAREAGKILGVSYTTIQNRCRGKFKNFGKHNGYEIVTKQEFEQYIKQKYKK